MKVAIVYDRVNKWGGAERVLLSLHELFPEAPLFTAVYDEVKAPWAKAFPEIVPSFLRKIPFMQDKHELLGWLTPLAFEQFNFDSFDIVISVTSEAGKGIITKPGTLHFCYCLTPTRYLWSGYEEYLNTPPSKLSWIPFYKFLAKPVLNYVKTWDKVASSRPDHMIAISTEVRDRIIQYYNRVSDIIFPPVNTVSINHKNHKTVKSDKYFLFVSRLIPYKRAELAVKAFNELGDKLIIVGRGSEEKYLKSIAKENVEFIDYLEDKELFELYRNAEALIFPGLEDFGIVMVESLASGTPVIAYKGGGAKDIVIEGKTGIFFDKQEITAIIQAVGEFKSTKFNKDLLIKSAGKFSKEKFKKEFKAYIENAIK